MVEQHHVARVGLDGIAWQLAGVDAPELLATPFTRALNDWVQRLGKTVSIVASPGEHAQATRIPGNGVQVEGYLDGVEWGVREVVRVPVGVADVVVPVAAGIVVVVSQERG